MVARFVFFQFFFICFLGGIFRNPHRRDQSDCIGICDFLCKYSIATSSYFIHMNAGAICQAFVSK